MNHDQYVSPIDALLVIDARNQAGARALFGINDTDHFVDVNGDEFLSPLDALLVIDRLNAADKPEGERVGSQFAGEVAFEEVVNQLVDNQQLPQLNGIVAAPLLTSSAAPCSLSVGRRLPREASKRPTQVTVPLSNALDPSLSIVPSLVPDAIRDGSIWPVTGDGPELIQRLRGGRWHLAAALPVCGCRAKPRAARKTNGT